MECDYSAGDECKEGDGGTLLEAGEEAARSLDESPLQIDEGQRAIWGGCQTLSKRRPVLIDAPVGALSLCAGAPLVLSGTGGPRMDGKLLRGVKINTICLLTWSGPLILRV